MFGKSTTVSGAASKGSKTFESRHCTAIKPSTSEIIEMLYNSSKFLLANNNKSKNVNNESAYIMATLTTAVRVYSEHLERTGILTVMKFNLREYNVNGSISIVLHSA